MLLAHYHHHYTWFQNALKFEWIFHDFATLRTMSKLSVGEGITFGCSLDWLAQVLGDCILIMFFASKMREFWKILNFSFTFTLVTLGHDLFLNSLWQLWKFINVFDISLDWKFCEWNWCPMINFDCLESFFYEFRRISHILWGLFEPN